MRYVRTFLRLALASIGPALVPGGIRIGPALVPSGIFIGPALVPNGVEPR